MSPRVSCPRCGSIRRSRQTVTCCECLRKLRRWRRGSLPQGQLARECTLAAVTRHPRAVSVIVQDVVDDYGTISRRTVSRHLARLERDGKVVRVGEFDQIRWSRARSREGIR